MYTIAIDPSFGDSTTAVTVNDRDGKRVAQYNVTGLSYAQQYRLIDDIMREWADSELVISINKAGAPFADALEKRGHDIRRVMMVRGVARPS